jgi:crotonobetainyl-CoA:carnitine CoA-transferase CaiB-like acyl-CoA transferase
VPKLPLTGIRVIALSFYWAGPLNTLMLADLGAQVIKVEHHIVRGPLKQERNTDKNLGFCLLDGEPGERPWDRQGITNQFMRGKFSLVLNLNNPKGKEIFLKLVKISDVVQDNYSTRAMIDFGLDYPTLKKVNPGIIQIRQPGFGTIGPYKDYIAGGCPTGVHGGLPWYHGYHDGPPMRPETCIVDPWAGIHACCAVLAALWQRRRTGQGQFIDSSQPESVATTLADRILGFQMKSSWPPRFGNRHYFMAPHGCYPCHGKDRWIAIAVESQEEWASLCRAMGNPDWAKDDRFSDQMDRYQNQDELDEHIKEWTIQYDHVALMHRLQEEGVAAGAVLDQQEIMSDSHLKERGYCVEIDHPETGRHPYPTSPWKMSKTPQTEYRRAPLLGEHNGYVLHDLLGYTEEEIKRLENEKVISDRPLA